MDRHIWTDKKGLIRVINRAVIAEYADETRATQEEVLRLAQREADLERRVCDLRVRELDLGTEVTRLNRRITEQVHQLADSESRGRQYCAELAEKAGRIRELEEERDGLTMTAEESDEIQAELAGALAIGFGEDLKPCIKPCPGHLGPKAREAVAAAAGAWRIANEENDRHIARIAELENVIVKALAHSFVDAGRPRRPVEGPGAALRDS